MNIDVMNLGNAIKKENQASQQDHAKAMIFLRHHLYDELKKKKTKKRVHFSKRSIDLVE
jgi:hypothetical protein